MKRFQRALSFVMALVMCVGLIPATGFAALVTTDPMYFTHVNLSAAGAAQISDWVSGAYVAEMQALEDTYGDQAWLQPEYNKARLMLRAMSLMPQSHEEPIEYFFPQSSTGSIHELTLYGYQDLDPSRISLTGVRPTGDLEKHAYGDGEGATYWYTVPIFVPHTDVTLGVKVDGALFAEIPLTHVDDGSPVSLYSTLWVKDYEENDSGLVTSLTLQVSGIMLPRTADAYLLTWSDGNPDVAAESLTDEDQYGYRLVTFTFDGGMSAQTISHADLSFVDHPAFFFGKGDHLVEQDIAGAPKYAFRTNYSFGDLPYWMLGGTVASFLSPYYCIYKAPNAAPLADPEVVPAFTAPSVTHAAAVDVTVAPGSYADGEMALSLDGGATWSDWRPAGAVWDLTLGEYGVYQIAMCFRKDGYKTFTLPAIAVDYNDGIPAAPTQAGVLVTATGADADKRGDAFVLTGEEDAQYTFCAAAPSGQTLEAVFRRADGTEVLTRDMAWSETNSRYELTLARLLLREAAKAAFRVKAGASTPVGRELTIALKTIEPAAIREIYAPTLTYEVRDGFYAVAPGAVITGVFETSGGENTSERMELVYITSNGASKTVTVPAAVDGNGQRTAAIALPEDTASLTSLSYQLLEDGVVTGRVDYDVSKYRVWAESRVTGIPAAYVGTTLTVKGAGASKYVVLTAANYAEANLGDLPTGAYTYELTGASGHIAGGTVSVTRGEDIVLTGLPALGSVTAATTGFTGDAGTLVNPPAQITLNLTTPDGTAIKILGAAGVKMDEIPVGSTGTVTLDYDYAAYEEVMDCTPASHEITVNGEENVAFTYRPFTYRTISGSVWGNKTYPSGYVSTFVPGGAKVTVTQEITRGGKTETYTQTAAVDARSTTGNRGRWSVRCYDNIPAKVEAKAFTWGTQTRTVTESGNVNLGQITMTYGDEMIVRLEATVETPASVKADGSNYYGSADSIQSRADSSFLQVDYIDAGGKTYYKSSGAYEVETVNGQAYLTIKEGIVVGNEHVGVHAYGSCNYGNMSLSLGAWGQAVSVKEDKDGVPVASFTAINYGGELRATVVDDPESGMTGFLVLFDSDTRCTFAKGTGLLRIPYSQVATTGEKTVVALMVRDEDADAMAEILNTNCKAIYDVLPNGDMQHDAYYRLWDYDRKLPYAKMGLPQNRIVYLENMTPGQIVGTEFLPPYRFTYHFELSDNPGKVWMIGTLEKRFPEQVSKDPLRSLEIFVPQGDDFWTATESDLVASSNFYADGRLIAAPNVWRKDSVTKSSITAEIPLSNGNMAAFSVKLKYGGQWDGSNSTEQKFTCIEHVPIFAVINPGDVYIADQLKSQGLGNKPEDVQAGWKLNLAIRAFSTDDDDENVITVYDNGTQIKRFSVSRGRYEQNDTGESIILGGSMQKIQVALTDNLQAGVHALWAERTYHGEVLQTEPVVFTLIAGAEHNEVYISELNWTHWNSRIPGKADHMYFENLSDLAGENIWIWPGKRHQMSFKVNNATSAELAGVTLAYRTLEAKAPTIPTGATSASMGNLASLPVQYDTVTKRIACRLISENHNANYSIWGFDDEDLGYLQGFDFEFQYDAAIEKEVTSMTLAEMDQLETESFYRANSLGPVPDLNEMATEIASMSDAELNAAFTDMAEISAELPRRGVKLQVKENNDKSFRAELEAPTDVVAEYTVTMQDSGTEQLPEIWQLMDTEREFGNQNPDEQGWDVVWAEFDTAQGEVLIRTASFEGTDATGTAAILSHSTYYFPEQVAATLMGESGSSSGGSGSDPSGGGSITIPASPTLAQLTQNPKSGTNEDHWTKKVYDFSSTAYAVADIGYQGLKDFIWLDAALNTNGKIDPAGQWINTWGDAKFAKGMDKTFKILGAADTLITFAKGPSGKDPGSLDALLSMVRDEKARKSLERQLKDYEEIRNSVYTQERTMSTISTTVGLIPGAGIVGKIGLFVFNIGNSMITGWTKDYNDQVYNSTLHDIQLQIQLERRRAEVLAKKSYDEAEQWLRDRMDHFYGKGKWSERALQEERKYWVLVRFPNGTLKYVWHEKVPNFDVYLDPSGFVYEAVEENRLDGVTATLYYSETENGNYSVWKDATGEQYNPQFTADEGRYSWMVPTGWWKVRYEKDGYLISETKPMRVPPVHTAVNIGLLSTEAPRANVSAADGKITVIFSKYMQLESLVRLYGEDGYDSGSFDSSAFAVQFHDGNGLALHGTVTFPDKTANTGYLGDGYGQDVIASKWFVRTAIFTPDDATTDLDGVTRTYAEGIRSYSGVLLDTANEAALYLVTLDPDGGELGVSCLATAADGKLAKLPAPTREGYTFDGWFTAPGGGTQVTADTVFTDNATVYARWKATVATPVLPASGSFTGGKTITIACHTDGATIYYTTDGSVPTTAGTVYTGAFTVSDTATVRAIAVKSDMTDSGIASETYTKISGTSSSSVQTYRPTITQATAAAGKTTVTPSRPMRNDKVTVTVMPNAGYEVVNVVVKDAKGNAIAVTKNADGTYSFTQPDGAVTIEPEFKEAEEQQPARLAFTDVAEGAYYYNAVAWAVANGVTAGTSATIFSPEASCTRAQMVTFLWNVAGKPEPKKAAAFSDVAHDAYYAKAVAWAKEQGITSGTGATTFSPDDVVTRAQTVTFLFRALKGAARGGNLFADVEHDAYYAAAVTWAKENGVTAGTSATTFSPDDDCLRAQIVTFLYKAYNK